MNLSFQQIYADDPPFHEKKTLRARAVGILSKLAPCASKAVIGIISNSMAIALDAINNLSAASSTLRR